MSNLEYTHTQIGEEVESISGHYMPEKELLLDLNGKQVLCIIGVAVWDRACCGSGGLRYALVPGYIVSHKTDANEDGMPLSQVEPIENKNDQKQIKLLISRKDWVQQVNFW